MKKQRDIWIDNIKVLACVLVVIGHFLQSMVKADIIPKSFGYNWFDTTIYYFHVPLFFICSGYLFQKYYKVQTKEQWVNNVAKKLVALGIPYFVFSFATWILKKVFSSYVNTQIGGLGQTLFLNPVSPYWYLYTLFFIFFISFTVEKNWHVYTLFMLGLACKFMRIMGMRTGIYAIDRTMDSWIWFVWGILFAKRLISFMNKVLSTITLLVFIFVSLLVKVVHIEFVGRSFALGSIACYSIISLIYHVSVARDESAIQKFLSKYTMPVFLMHTLFAALTRSLLMKLGILSIPVHFAFGIGMSFIGPILAMLVLEKLKPLDFIVYPTKYIRFQNGSGQLPKVISICAMVIVYEYSDILIKNLVIFNVYKNYYMVI